MGIPLTDRSCCGCCHVKTGTWILAIVQAVFGLLFLIRSIIELTGLDRDIHSSGFIARQVIMCIITVLFFISIVFLILALLKERPQWMVPHLIMSLIYLIWQIIQVIWMVAAQVGGSVAAGSIIVFIIVNVIFILLMVYFLYVEYCCYKWMKGEITSTSA